MILYHKKLCTMYMHAHCKTITELHISSFTWQQGGNRQQNKGGNKVLGGLGNIIFPPIFIASLLVTVSL